MSERDFVPCTFIFHFSFFVLSFVHSYAEPASLAAALLAALPSLASTGSRSKRAFFDPEVDEDLDEARFDEEKELGRAFQRTSQVHVTHMNPVLASYRAC